MRVHETHYNARCADELPTFLAGGIRAEEVIGSSASEALVDTMIDLRNDETLMHAERWVRIMCALVDAGERWCGNAIEPNKSSSEQGET
jgi:hypothetical protein